MAKLWSELILLFVVIPFAVLYWIKHFANYLMPILGVMGLCCLAILLADKQFKRIKLWHLKEMPAGHILTRSRGVVKP